MCCIFRPLSHYLPLNPLQEDNISDSLKEIADDIFKIIQNEK